MPVAPEPPAIAATRRWIAEAIVGENLCPFAAGPWRTDRVELLLAEGPDPAHASALLAGLADRMARSPEPETALLVLPEGYSDLADFLDFFYAAEDWIAAEYPAAFALAAFHPEYAFADEPPDAPAHLIHRSPYPTLHVLRESSIGRAVDAYPGIEDIPARNTATAARLGREFFEAFRARGSR